MIDLHLHSTASDGTDSSKTIIEKCAKLGLKLCSIADHDTADGQSAAIAAAHKRNIPYLTGIEFSVCCRAGELHILGYGYRPEDFGLQKLFVELKADRHERIVKIVDKLNACGVRITLEDVFRQKQGDCVGRPHVALAMMEKGYVSDFSEAFSKYLNEEGSCYVQRRKITQREAIDVIRNAGGLPVLAHPKFIRTDDLPELVKEMKQMGLGGIEAFYPVHSDSDVQRYCALAREYSLIVTSGSDYHGKNKQHNAIACEKRTDPLLEESVEFLMKKIV